MQFSPCSYTRQHSPIPRKCEGEAIYYVQRPSGNPLNISRTLDYIKETSKKFSPSLSPSCNSLIMKGITVGTSYFPKKDTGIPVLDLVFS